MSADVKTLSQLESAMESGEIFKPFNSLLIEHNCYWEVLDLTYFDMDTSKLVLYRYHPNSFDGVSEFLGNITMRFNNETDLDAYFESWPDGSGPVFHSTLTEAVHCCEDYAVKIINDEILLKQHRETYFKVWRNALQTVGFSIVG